MDEHSKEFERAFRIGNIIFIISVGIATLFSIVDFIW